MCFIGLARPAIGAIPPISEMQARLFALVLSGKCALPKGQDMEAKIQRDAKKHRDYLAVVTDRITGLVDFTSYMDELADLIGCKPKWKDLIKTPTVLYRVYFNPFMACQYRLCGPHQKRDLAVRTMKQVHITVILFFYGCALATLVLIDEILYRIGFSSCKPRLRL